MRHTPNNVINKFISLLDEHVPQRISKPNKYKHKKHPWITQAILKSICTRDHLSKKRIHSKATPDFNFNNIDQQYKQYRNLLNRVIRNAKSQYWNTKFTESKNNIKQTLKTYFMSRKSKIYPHHSKSTTTCNDPMKISNAFSNYFANIGPKLADKIKTTNNYTDYMQNQLPSSLVMEETTCTEIINIIQNIKSKPSTGFDNIFTKLMKFCGNHCLTYGGIF